MQQPGANTSDIITQYISAMKALRVLDPSVSLKQATEGKAFAHQPIQGVALESVAWRIREYLARRQDTVRCIVSKLISDTPNDLKVRSFCAVPLLALILCAG